MSSVEYGYRRQDWSVWLVGALCWLIVADTVLTHIGLRQGYTEANFILEGILARYRLFGFWALKIVTLLLALAVFRLAKMGYVYHSFYLLILGVTTGTYIGAVLSWVLVLGFL